MDERPRLAERKRRAAMRRVQQAALDLFDERGYENVTIEQVADAAEVSASSIYRYFGSKEQLVLHDDYDFDFFQILDEELESHPPVEAVRRALARVMSEYFDRDAELEKRKTRYALEELALRPALLQMTDQFCGMVAGALERASGRPENDLEMRVIASALMWSLVTATRHWHDSGYANDLDDEMEQALSILEKGLGQA